MGGRPGLFHSVPLRPYNEHMRPYNEHIPFMMVLHRTHIIVGARCNGVE
jgi:hypothetical protein